MPQHQAKRLAAAAAVELLPEQGVIGLGSGATADLFIEALAELVRAGRRFVGVPTSEASRRKATACGIELLSDDGPWIVDVCVDGADEVSPALDLIKGGGGCHTREKIVNNAAALNIIVAEESKLVQRLGERWAVPVEIVPFGYRATLRLLERWGQARMRMRDGAHWLTDSGNLICDVRVEPIADPAGLDRELVSLPGVVETGLFCGRADVVVVGSHETVRHLRRK
ncbi:MAG: ribose-5-phosphate isomerase RpiA [Polyangiaceae bacterium]|nr:ribose-5-phosphate isomerase RpiA [Polyangiaceae bacterium]